MAQEANNESTTDNENNSICLVLLFFLPQTHPIFSQSSLINLIGLIKALCVDTGTDIPQKERQTDRQRDRQRQRERMREGKRVRLLFENIF